MTGDAVPARRDIQVLMSTYNGTRFLGEQLTSLRDQDVADRVRVLVRDDGSTDGTPDLVRDFDPGGLAVDVITGANLGVIASFRELLRAADRGCDVFLLCDQDDVWLVDKVRCAADAVLALPADMPGLYCGRSLVVDRSLHRIGVTASVPHGPSLANALVQNIAPGHTMAMNRAMLDLAAATLRPDRVVMHDCWLYALGCAVGRVVVDETPRALYRQYGANEVGYRTTPWGRAWGGVVRLFTLDRSQWTRQALELRQAVGARMSDADRALLDAFLDQRILGTRLAYLRRYGLVYQRRTRPVVASVLFALGRYRLSKHLPVLLNRSIV
jgi:hypothetical protein